MKHNTGDRVYVNRPASLWHGARATIVDIQKPKKGRYPYCLEIEGVPYAYWFPEDELSDSPIDISALQEEVNRLRIENIRLKRQLSMTDRDGERS